MGQGNLRLPNISSSHLPPFEAPDPQPFTSLVQDGISTAITWSPFESHLFVGLPDMYMHMDVIKNFFSIINQSFIGVGESLSQEPRRIEGKLFFLPPLPWASTSQRERPSEETSSAATLILGDPSPELGENKSLVG